MILGNKLCNSESLLPYKKPPWICGINQQLFYSARRFSGSGNLDTGTVGWLVLAYRCLRPRIEKLQGCGSLGSEGELPAGSLTHMAGSGGCCFDHLPTHSLCMLCWGSSQHDGQVPKTSNQEEAGKSYSTSHDLPREVTGCNFCQSHQPSHIRKEGTYIPPFSRTRVKNHIVRRTHGMGEVAVVVFGKSNQLHLIYKVKIILLE